MNQLSIRYLADDPSSPMDDPQTLLTLTYEYPPAAPATKRALVPISLLGPNRVTEVWQVATGIVRHREVEGAHLHYTDDLMALYMSMGEENESLEEITRTLYAHLFRLTAEAGYPTLVRIWNAIAHINDDEKGMERYRRFCVGRADAFDLLAKSGSPMPPPAASAVGAEGFGMTLVALASKERVVQIENPRQLSAYDYPRDYGPKSPHFSRATRTDGESCPDLFVSGTASIVGHVTLHQGAVDRQLDETISNIEAVAAEARFAMTQLTSLKVYLRNRDDYSFVHERLVKKYPHVAMIFLHAAICRADLLLEIEAIFSKEGGA